ncbi:MAG: DUF433 domain-containing protein [Candidatus Sumerlaeota bacterium]|nr:DUF433 domain-containing protein [Candidatus Sumerlaeota bacterium]
MNWQKYIEQRPSVLTGKPVFKGTRLSVQMILEHLADGWTEQDLLRSFPTLRPAHLRAAMALAAEKLAVASSEPELSLK